jgi:hypothetical protein
MMAPISAPVRSPFQLLWLSVSDKVDTAGLATVRRGLVEQQARTFTGYEREIIDWAIKELDGLVISRLAIGLREGRSDDPGFLSV